MIIQIITLIASVGPHIPFPNDFRCNNCPNINNNHCSSSTTKGWLLKKRPLVRMDLLIPITLEFISLMAGNSMKRKPLYSFCFQGETVTLTNHPQRSNVIIHPEMGFCQEYNGIRACCLFFVISQHK